MTMQADLLALLRRGWTSPLRALNDARCLSLSQRVGDMIREGIPIEKRWLKLPNGKKCREYRVDPFAAAQRKVEIAELRKTMFAAAKTLTHDESALVIPDGKTAMPAPPLDDGCYFADCGDRDRFALAHSKMHDIPPLV